MAQAKKNAPLNPSGLQDFVMPSVLSTEVVQSINSLAAAGAFPPIRSATIFNFQVANCHFCGKDTCDIASSWRIHESEHSAALTLYFCEDCFVRAVGRGFNYDAFKPGTENWRCSLCVNSIRECATITITHKIENAFNSAFFCYNCFRRHIDNLIFDLIITATTGRSSR